MFLRLTSNGSGLWSAASRSFLRRAATSRMNSKHVIQKFLGEKVAGIGNVLRHNYERIAAPVIWKLAQTDLALLDKACREELATETCAQTARLNSPSQLPRRGSLKGSLCECWGR
jgi:hypothetical protein